MNQSSSGHMRGATDRENHSARRPNVIPFAPQNAAPSQQPIPSQATSLWRRGGAEIVNRLFPLFIIGPLFTLPLAMVGGNNYLLLAYLLGVGLWHWCCDGMPHRPSLGKQMFFLRVVSAHGQALCTLPQKVLRRSFSALSQTLYCLVFALSLPASAAQSQAETLIRGVLAPLHWLGFGTRATALLMFFALTLDALNLLCLALSPQGRSLGDWLAHTRVVTRKEAK